ncbi:hypothetical protein GM708_05480 [Vibrio cholerae]|nr:hypothetical protein [Vibrio cholerae]
MTLTDAVGRIQQIQSTLTMLVAPSARVQAKPPVMTTAGSSVPAPAQAATADRFADALADAGMPAAVPASAPASVPASVPPSAGVAEVPGLQPVPVPSSSDAARLFEAARAYEGVPYVWGGTDPATGLDCSGFVQRAYSDIGIQLPRVTWDQMNAGTHVRPWQRPSPATCCSATTATRVHVSGRRQGDRCSAAGPDRGRPRHVGDRRQPHHHPPHPARGTRWSGFRFSRTPAAVSGASGVPDAYAAQAAFLASMAR